LTFAVSLILFISWGNLNFKSCFFNDDKSNMSYLVPNYDS
jgi:hypothetical protein